MPSDLTLDTNRAPDLSTAAGRAELEAAIALAISVREDDPVRWAAALRKLLDADVANVALQQVELRAHATAKFGGDATGMYFTRDGLEQSSRLEVAAHRAARFAASGAAEVLDLCSGIGADARAFASAGLAVRCVESDPHTAAILAANLAGRAAEFRVMAAQDTDWLNAESVYLDPARRNSARRIFDPAAYSPSFDFVLTVLAQARLAAVKLAPGLPHELIPADVEAEWVSFARGVKEAVLWSRGFAETGPGIVRRRATVIAAAGGIEGLTDADPADEHIGAIGAFLYEPDGAVIRAGLVQQAAALLPNGRRIDEHLAYLSADSPVATTLARGYEVLEVMPYSVSRLRAELRRREVGIVEIKKRGVDVDPARLRRQLKPSGPNSLTVLLARVGEAHVAILATPLTPAN